MTRDKKPKNKKELDGLDIKVDSFGEVKSNLNIDEINEFLNKNVADKKFRARKNVDDIKAKKG